MSFVDTTDLAAIEADLNRPSGPPPVAPLDWVARLEKQLANRQGRLRTYSEYYDGIQPLAFAGEKFRKAFGGQLRAFSDNWCALVVDACEERLDVQGFRFPTGSGTATSADRDAWYMWQANGLDADSQLAHAEAMKLEEAYGLVWADPDDPDVPCITVESPLQVIVAMVPGSRKKRAAALKLWVDDDNWEYATLYLPDFIYKYRSRAKAKGNGPSWGSPKRWVERDVPGEPWPLSNPLGVVPVVPLTNRAKMLGGGQSELHNVIPVQNAINKLIADMMVASEYQSFRQRWVTGMDIPVDPETNEPIEPFKVAVDRLFIAENPDAKFGEFGEVDLTNYVKAIELLVQHVASQTRTPPHYFYLSGQFPSGESIKSAETGLVAKARRKMRLFGEGWEEIIRLGFAVLDDPRQDAVAAETIWGDPESRTESEHIDAVVKRRALMVPFQQLWEDAGYSEEQQARFREMQQAELADPVLQALLAQDPATTAIKG